jgi:hypothetical protein
MVKPFSAIPFQPVQIVANWMKPRFMRDCLNGMANHPLLADIQTVLLQIDLQIAVINARPLAWYEFAYLPGRFVAQADTIGEFIQGDNIDK